MSFTLNNSNEIYAVETSGNTTYVSYNIYNVYDVCSIMKIVSYSGNSYDTFWANGNKVKDKIWSDRYTYSYSAIT